MKTFNLGLIALFAAFAISSCSDEDSWKYGDKQKLANTTWHGSDYAFMCGGPPLTAEITISFSKGTFTLSGHETDDEDTTYVLQGEYIYKHPHLTLKPADQEPIEAWIGLRGVTYIGGAYDTRLHELMKVEGK